ncbi:bifunctional transcriptional regulator/O-phospho-L-serine synthase SbnI [Staphylococcus ratti]|uniref:Bifunctional transcriptional regulator/O-phospho-L-serine synthase SbnI n=1 Tax=Staphylococcus ratti TaxID=2892440 RepID=A0ABY3PCV1_9STAP|nr:bifunctional transcriptional regulator/O-phospho-L-serine synthase SbnI [Staphylococcus ratti]UEX90151.1 bifunctional transcriptional regulator/O-phospho-L-serine synthase SbnI [Staphylococcus ratti]
MKHMYKDLKLIPVDQIDLHEKYEPCRLEKTKMSIEADQFIRHPILATLTQTGRYMVIDGVHRFTSLKALGCKVVPVQVISETQYSISTWNHKVPFGTWWTELQQDGSLPWTTEMRSERPFITMCKGQDEQYLYLADLGNKKLEAWAKVVGSYSDACAVERVTNCDGYCHDTSYIMMKYQPLDIKEIEAVVERSETVPAGVTRFNVSGRCLNLQVPLEILKNGHNRSMNMAWYQFLKDKMANTRCYTEKVYLVEQ